MIIVSHEKVKSASEKLRPFWTEYKINMVLDIVSIDPWF